MKNYHWLSIIAILVVGYFIGVQWPSYGTSAISKVTGAIS